MIEIIVIIGLLAVIGIMLWWLRRPVKAEDGGQYIWKLYGLKDGKWYAIHASSRVESLMTHVLYLQDAYDAYRIE